MILRLAFGSLLARALTVSMTVLAIALSDWRETRRKGALTDTEGNLLMTRIDRALDSVIARESQKIENGLGVLSVVATASPFNEMFMRKPRP